MVRGLEPSQPPAGYGPGNAYVHMAVKVSHCFVDIPNVVVFLLCSLENLEQHRSCDSVGMLYCYRKQGTELADAYRKVVAI